MLRSIRVAKILQGSLSCGGPQEKRESLQARSMNSVSSEELTAMSQLFGETQCQIIIEEHSIAAHGNIAETSHNCAHKSSSKISSSPAQH